MLLKVLAAGSLLVAFSAGLWAQADLVELQKKERERRKKANPSLMVINDKTKAEAIAQKGVYSVTILKKQVESELNVAEETLSAESFGGKEKAAWVSRHKVLENDLALQREKILNVQVEIDNTMAARMNEINPLKYMELNKKIETLELTLLEEKNKLSEKEGELNAFLAEAREAGVPPGWLRE